MWIAENADGLGVQGIVRGPGISFAPVTAPPFAPTEKSPTYFLLAFHLLLFKRHYEATQDSSVRFIF